MSIIDTILANLNDEDFEVSIKRRVADHYTIDKPWVVRLTQRRSFAKLTVIREASTLATALQVAYDEHRSLSGGAFDPKGASSS